MTTAPTLFAPDRPKWPTTLPAQSTLQNHLHASTADTRTRTVLAFLEDPNPRARRRAFRMADCAQTIRFYLQPDGHAVRPWLSRCKDRLCPFCAHERVTQVAQRIAQAVAAMKQPRTVILTLKDAPRTLQDALQSLRVAFGKLRRTPLWRSTAKWGIYVTEITRNQAAGTWHPHIHLVYDGSFLPHAQLSRTWCTITGGAKIVWVAAVTNTTAIANELAKYIAKAPNQHLLSPSEIREYATATAAARLLQTFGRKPPVKPTEEDANPGPKTTTPAISLPKLLWLARQPSPIATAALELIAQLWPGIAPAIYAELPHIEPPDHKAQRTKRFLARIRGSPPQRPAPTITGEHRADAQRQLATFITTLVAEGHEDQQAKPYANLQH